ncbi:MAG: ammonium transporter [Deltaproteobacteria bacterium]|nr:ammonium transporter [Deltaproteobacteria bacterium]
MATGLDPTLKVMLDTVWVVICGALVFFMNAGFALLETGLCRSKNAVSILAKNFTVAAFAGLGFYALGFGLMFADGNAFAGLGGAFLTGADNSPAMGDAYKGLFSSLNWAGVPLEAKFFFQACFAMTAASIVSGAVAERIRFGAYILFSLVLVTLVYPIVGHWIWGGGFLAKSGFWDFAGSTQVHSLGGWAALAGALMLGARRGKYDADGKIRPIPGHNMSLATLGGFILWLGWFGFNAGSTMAADATAIAHVAMTTLIASMAGVVGALLLNYFRTKTFDLSMMINGALAGLVGITAPCAFVSSQSALIIGFIAGILAVFAVVLFDRVKVDDPVGAISVHLVGGVWGTLAVGFFAEARFVADVGNGLFFGGGIQLLEAQALGVVTTGTFVLTFSFATWWLIDKVIGLRVSEEDEYMGLDRAEMGLEAYAADPFKVGEPARVLPELDLEGISLEARESVAEG